MIFKVKDKCNRVNIFTNRVQPMYKGCNVAPSVFVVKSVDALGCVSIFNYPDVLFDSDGNVIVAPPNVAVSPFGGINSSDWVNYKLVKAG